MEPVAGSFEKLACIHCFLELLTTSNDKKSVIYVDYKD